MSLWSHELRLFLRQPLAAPLLALLLLLASASVWAGLAEITRQHAAIDRILPQQAADEAAVAAWATREGDAGNVAYYTHYATWDRPSPLAFAALGQRDVAPFVLRIRALALEGQINESEAYNAELALPGRFDWAFVLTYLAPLFIIVLLHDLVSSEREGGRLLLLTVMARSETALWVRRVVLRVGLVILALVLPLAVGGLLSGAGQPILGMAGLAAAYAVFWALVCVAVERFRLASVTSAATLAAVWLIMTLVLPGLALLAINAAVPVRQGVELTLAQREAVHAGWDKPKEATLAAFFREEPAWRDTAPMRSGFHWKWYYAFQHLGDLSVAEQVRAYRAGLERRNALSGRIGLLLPPVGLQMVLHRLAETDLVAQLAYQDRIRRYHRELRHFFYPFLFREQPFGPADFARAPRWRDSADTPRPPRPGA